MGNEVVIKQKISNQDIPENNYGGKINHRLGNRWGYSTHPFHLCPHRVFEEENNIQVQGLAKKQMFRHLLKRVTCFREKMAPSKSYIVL